MLQLDFKDTEICYKWTDRICKHYALPQVVVELTLSIGFKNVLGFYHPKEHRIVLNVPSGLTYRTLFHEMAHHKQYVFGGEKEITRWHTLSFYDAYININNFVMMKYGLYVALPAYPPQGARSMYKALHQLSFLPYVRKIQAEWARKGLHSLGYQGGQKHATHCLHTFAAKKSRSYTQGA